MWVARHGFTQSPQLGAPDLKVFLRFGPDFHVETALTLHFNGHYHAGYHGCALSHASIGIAFQV